MIQNTDISSLLYRLLIPKATLDARLFDYRGQMHSEVRQQLLANAEYIINQTIAPIKGLKVQDIYVNGSSAGYFYTDSSDIDMRIEIHNENCSYLIKDDKTFSRFLLSLQNGHVRNFIFTLDERLVDVKLKAFGREIIGLYSVLHDHWEIEPDKNITAGLTYDGVIAEYTKRYHDINTYLEQIKQNGKLNCDEGINELEEYYRELFKVGWSDIHNYTIHRLLVHCGILQNIKDIVSNARREYLSIK